MARFPILHRIRRGAWLDHTITASQICVAAVALLGIAGWLTLNPFLLLTFIFAQPLVILGLILFLIAALFFEKAMIVENYDPGEVIYEQGAPGRSIYLVRSGSVDTFTKQPDGKPEKVATFVPGHYFGYVALAGLPHKVTAKAVGATQLIRIRPRDFRAMFAEIPELHAQIPELRNKIVEAMDRLAPK